MTAKTQRITRKNRNRYRVHSLAANHKNPKKAADIIKNNLGHKVKSRRLKREKATVQNFTRSDLRRAITTPVEVFCKDLTQPIKGKQQGKYINRKLNQ